MKSETEIDFPDFEINDQGPFSSEFIKRNIRSFKEACTFIHQLPYRRNPNKEDLMTLFTDNCGTCGVKHAVLMKLINEQGAAGFQLITGIYKMSAATSPATANTLKKFDLECVPEAHNYLRLKGQILDFTKPGMKSSDFMDHLLEESEIAPEQVGNYKVVYHKDFLKRWLAENPQVKYSLDEFWAIREQCIKDLY